MKTIDIDKLICSFLSHREKDNGNICDIIKMSLKDQGLEYKYGSIVEIEGNDGGISPNSDFKIEKDKWYVCVSQFMNCLVGKVYKATSNDRIMDAYGTEYDIHSDELRHFRPWTIKDAKDGDILYTKGGIGYEKKDIIFIFKCIGERDYLDEPCIEHYCHLCEDGFYVASQGQDFMGVLSYNIKQGTCPATKEQRELLLYKMKEAGYGFDFRLNKLFQVPKSKDVVEYEGKTYLATDWDGRGWQCASCEIRELCICDAAWCTGCERADKRDVVFKEQKESPDTIKFDDVPETDFGNKSDELTKFGSAFI